MNNPYIIIIQNSPEKEILESFHEEIRSSFVSKVVNEKLIIISIPEETKSETLYKKIEPKVSNDIYFLVVEFRKFYGTLPLKAFEWYQETFTDVDIEFTKIEK